ncbi:MAG: response regulator [Bdellovibrionales bacterium]|nr:response regulator [Bdellovibrionales bacterium]
MAKILIVEDSTSQAAIMSELVRSAGHEAAICTDVQKGIAQTLKAVQPQVVLLDLVLLGTDGKPVADGFQLCREIKRVSENRVGVIIVSAKVDDESAEWAVLQGADAFLQKPFKVEDLHEVLNEVLERLGI